MTLSALPTWVMVQLIWPVLPKQHPWRQRGPNAFTLRQWHVGRTDLARVFDAVLWFWLLITTLAIIALRA